jgi:thioredoxin-like negative regulator of GroEL
VFKASADKHVAIKHAKIEPSNAQTTFVNFGVNYVPTLILFKDGKELARKGFMNAAELDAWLEQAH